MVAEGRMSAIPHSHLPAIPTSRLNALHLSGMPGKPEEDAGTDRPKERLWPLLWLSGCWVLPILALAYWLGQAHPFAGVALLTSSTPPLACLRDEVRGRSGTTQAPIGHRALPHFPLARGVASG